MHNQDIFSLCLEDMEASLELVAELENELGNVRNQTGDTTSAKENARKKKSEPRAWAV